MSNSIFQVPVASNEPILSYAPGTADRKHLQDTLKKMRSEVIDVPMYINGKAIHTTKKGELRPPHDHKHLLGNYSIGDASHVTMAIDAALAARSAWADMEWEQRFHIFKGGRTTCWSIPFKNKCSYDVSSEQKCISSRNRCCL